MHVRPIYFFAPSKDVLNKPDSVKGIERMISAGNKSIRPIAMTTFAAIFALIPLSMVIGAGSDMLQPLAIAIVSGLVVQIPLVLMVLPGLLALSKEHK